MWPDALSPDSLRPAAAGATGDPDSGTRDPLVSGAEEEEAGPLAVTLDPIEVDPTRQEPPLAWTDLFGNDHRVEVELGCGKGMFLAGAAALNPEHNFLGNERARKYYRRAVQRLSRAGLPNVRMMGGDGADLLARWIAPGSVAVLHIYFPDPWPKKRHHKRRIFRPEVLELAHRALGPGGEFRLATDHAPYREVIEALFDAHLHLFAPLPWDPTGPAQLPSNYSLKWQRAGRPLWWARFSAVPRTSPGC